MHFYPSPVTFYNTGIIYLFVNKGQSTLKIEVTNEGNIRYSTTGLSSLSKIRAGMVLKKTGH